MSWEVDIKMALFKVMPQARILKPFLDSAYIIDSTFDTIGFVDYANKELHIRSEYKHLDKVKSRLEQANVLYFVSKTHTAAEMYPSIKEKYESFLKKD